MSGHRLLISGHCQHDCYIVVYAGASSVAKSPEPEHNSIHHSLILSAVFLFGPLFKVGNGVSRVIVVLEASNVSIWFAVAYLLSGVHTMRHINLHRSWVVV